MYYIWFDESDKEGEFYSNFYGGILIKSEHLEKVLQMMRCIVEEVGLAGEEIKWQKVNQYTFDKYVRLVDFVFDLLENGFAKIRIFFRNNQYVPTGLTREQKRNEFSLLYYQFIKHSFGLQYSNPTKRPVKLKLFIDDIPLKGEDKRGSSDISSDSFLKRKTAEQIVYLNCDQQMYSYEQQFSISCLGSLYPQMHS